MDIGSHPRAGYRQPVDPDVDAWVRAYLPLVHRYFRRRAAHDDCDDLSAEVFAIAWRRREDVPPEAVLPWLYRTAGFVLANHRRVRTDLAVGDAGDVAELASPELRDDPAEAAIASAGMRAAWAALSDRDREVLLLTAWEGLSGRELAEALGISVGGAGAALFRARAALAQALEATDAPDGERSGAGGTQG